MKALFLPQYSQLGGSSKHMIYSYLEFFEAADIHATIVPLFDDHYFSLRVLTRPASLYEIASHSGYFSRRVFKRLGQVLRSGSFDLVVLEKELLPYFPFGLESLLRRNQPRVITLYDDAVYVGYQRHPWALIRLLCREKIQHVMQISSRVIVWNKYLADYAARFNPHVTIVNSGVDLRRYRLKSDRERAESRVIIGWIGTPNSFPYLAGLENVLCDLARRYGVKLRVVSSVDYQSSSIPVENRRWGLETEVDDLCTFDIGIMPLADDPWTRGKSAYKAVQYMAVGIPVVGSPVGAASEVIGDGVSGYLASTPEQWRERLAKLIENPELRRRQGLAGRQRVEQVYSIQAVAPRLVEAIQSVAG
jgi:glycosyltransferase involved in cell wall biosynthesis